jgi:hypothetical protein
LLRLLPFIEAGAVGHLDGAGRRLVASTIGLSARAGAALSPAFSGASGEGVSEAGAAHVAPDHPGSPTPPHLEAILGSGPHDHPAGGSSFDPLDPLGPQGDSPPALPSGGDPPEPPDPGGQGGSAGSSPRPRGPAPLGAVTTSEDGEDEWPQARGGDGTGGSRSDMGPGGWPHGE